jgi:hypothetical protein
MTKTDIASLVTDLGAIVEQHQARVSDYDILRALITVAAAVAARDDEKPYTRTQRCLEEARDALAQEEGERG